MITSTALDSLAGEILVNREAFCAIGALNLEVHKTIETKLKSLQLSAH